MTVRDREATFARKLLEVREQRYERFGHALFDEYAWEMLLALFIADAEGRRLTARQAMEESRASPAIGRRWLAHLSHVGMVRVQDLDDPDRPVTLTDATLHDMEQFLKEASRTLEI